MDMSGSARRTRERGARSNSRISQKTGGLILIGGALCDVDGNACNIGHERATTPTANRPETLPRENKKDPLGVHFSRSAPGCDSGVQRRHFIASPRSSTRGTFTLK